MMPQQRVRAPPPLMSCRPFLSSRTADGDGRPARAVQKSERFDEGNDGRVFNYKKMIVNMMQKALQSDRDFLDDVFRLIAVYLTHGSNNIEKHVSEWRGAPETREKLREMIDVYGIRNATRRGADFSPTLCRISEAMPHVSLLLASCIYSDPQSDLRLWVSDAELGTEINYHFKCSYFPGLMRLEEAGTKVQAGLLLFNLCQTMSILKTTYIEEKKMEGSGGAVGGSRGGGSMDVSTAFTFSCRTSNRIVQERLAPLASRIRFTRFVRTLPVTPEILHTVWSRVIGTCRIALTSHTAVTQLHEKVLQQQPLDLVKWYILMEGYENENVDSL